MRLGWEEGAGIYWTPDTSLPGDRVRDRHGLGVGSAFLVVGLLSRRLEETVGLRSIHELYMIPLPHPRNNELMSLENVPAPPGLVITTQFDLSRLEF